MVLGVAGTNSSFGKKADVDAEDLFIDIGATNSEEAKKVVPLGSYIIHDTDMVELLDDKLRIAALYREKYPESSLQELSEIISIETNNPITKSGLNHRLKKISEFAKKIQ